VDRYDKMVLQFRDVLAETERRVASSRVDSIDDVRAAGQALAGFSADLAAEEAALKRFLYGRLYNAPQLLAVRKEAQRVIAGLASAYRSDRRLIPTEWRVEGDETLRLRTIGDFMAGMTDRFAVARHRELVGPVELPDHF
jgi:dGTPase